MAFWQYNLPENYTLGHYLQLNQTMVFVAALWERFKEELLFETDLSEDETRIVRRISVSQYHTLSFTTHFYATLTLALRQFSQSHVMVRAEYNNSEPASAHDVYLVQEQFLARDPWNYTDERVFTPDYGSVTGEVLNTFTHYSREIFHGRLLVCGFRGVKHFMTNAVVYDVE